MMNDTKSLVESRTFWSSVFALVGVVGGSFHINWLVADVANPATLNMWMTTIGLIASVFFRVTSTSEITSILPPGGKPKFSFAFIAVPVTLAIMLGMGGCSPLDLTPQQQANLDRFIAAGQVVVKGAGTFYCVMEPTTTTIIRVFDTSKGTAGNTTKLDQATAIACQAALASGLIVQKGPA